MSPRAAVSPFTSRIPDTISTIRALFAQKNRSDIQCFSSKSRVSYESTEEKSSSRRGQTKSIRRTGDGTRGALRKLAAYGWNEKALTTNVTTVMFGEREFRSQSPNDSEVAISCDLDTEPGLRNREAGGEISKEKTPPSLFRNRSFHNAVCAIEPMVLLRARPENKVLLFGVVSAAKKHAANSPRLPCESPQLHQQNTTPKTRISAKPPAKTRKAHHTPRQKK
jgi:hypothetical protein